MLKEKPIKLKDRFDQNELKEQSSIIREWLIGLAEEKAITEAKEYGWRIRTMQKNGEAFCGTMDLGPERVNIIVENGIVTKTYIG